MRLFFVAAAIGLFIANSPLCSADVLPKHPNIVFILADDK